MNFESFIQWIVWHYGTIKMQFPSWLLPGWEPGLEYIWCVYPPHFFAAELYADLWNDRLSLQNNCNEYAISTHAEALSVIAGFSMRSNKLIARTFLSLPSPWKHQLSARKGILELSAANNFRKLYFLCHSEGIPAAFESFPDNLSRTSLSNCSRLFNGSSALCSLIVILYIFISIGFSGVAYNQATHCRRSIQRSNLRDSCDSNFMEKIQTGPGLPSEYHAEKVQVSGIVCSTLLYWNASIAAIDRRQLTKGGEVICQWTSCENGWSEGNVFDGDCKSSVPWYPRYLWSALTLMTT